MSESHILMVAGDPSGDQHAAALARALKQGQPGLRISALGGTHLREAADRFVYPLVGLGGFGFWEPILKLPRLWSAWRHVRAIIRTEKPQVVVPIDFYGFNIHVARLARKQGIPVVYYISPQVWASRPQRVQKLAKVLSKMLTIFPFEETLYRKAGIPVRFVGHPLLDRVPGPAQPNGILSIGLFPGSRWSIVERHLPIVVQTAYQLRQRFPQAAFTLFRPAELDEVRYRPFLARARWIQLAYDPNYEKRRKLSLAISVSGTAALENTLLGIPMVVMYKLSPLTYVIAKHLIRVPYVAIPNLLAGKPLVPEMLQGDATPAKLAEAARNLIENPASRGAMRDALLSLRKQLGAPGAAKAAAAEIAPFLSP